ncbi:MAG: EF-hand domain-containing protein [Paludibacterium sp.]|uniref:EF-hand domain-containing protein n=1 Tax=Paludibacterium sp. TaxID=1917523 RepID=UPI0025E0A683|nr:EF-hand domain-containing protein [Paludibacterium sp.]MBV8049167.1 EF-hand domain-containing protein [Paludibacterium sp.]MBV8649306.1 EF-hand domain-containing protein [Paludibacterium sp.]
MKPYTPYTLLIALLIATLVGMAWMQSAHAAPMPASRAGLAELGDPYVPPRVKARARAKGVAPMTTGATLQAQALGKLQKKFNEADSDHSGRVSKAQAQRAGFGYMVNHFDAIDTHHRGSVSFDELKTYLRASGAKF